MYLQLRSDDDVMTPLMTLPRSGNQLCEILCLHAH